MGIYRFLFWGLYRIGDYDVKAEATQRKSISEGQKHEAKQKTVVSQPSTRPNQTYTDTDTDTVPTNRTLTPDETFS